MDSGTFSSLAKTCKYVRENFKNVYYLSYQVTRTKPAIFERTGAKATEETEDANDGNVPPESSERKPGQQKATGDGPSHVSKSKDHQKQGQESGQKEETDQTATNNQHDRDPQATPTAQYQDSEKPTRIGYLSRLFGPKCIFGVSGPHGPVPDELVWAITRRGRYAMNLVDRDTQAIVKGQETDQSGGVSQARNIKDILAMDAALDPCTVSFLITHLAYGLHDELPETSFDYLALDMSALEVIRKIADRQPSQHNVQLVDELAECLGRLALNGPSREVISAFLGKKAESPKQCIDGTEDGSRPLESGTDMNLPKLAAEEILRWTKNEPRPCCIASKRLGELGTVICMDHCCSSGWAAQIKTPNVTVVQKHDEEIPQASKIEEHPNGKEEGNEEISAKVSGGQPSSK